MCVLILAIPALASDLGNQAPPKPPSVVAPNVPDRARQGGDTVATALSHLRAALFRYRDHDGIRRRLRRVLPHRRHPDRTSSTRTRPTADEADHRRSLRFELRHEDRRSTTMRCTSSPATTTSTSTAPCGIYTSKIEGARISRRTARTTSSSTAMARPTATTSWRSPYFEPCVVEPALPGASPEGEPPLHDDYIDSSGTAAATSADLGRPFQADHRQRRMASASLCGVSGWYTSGWHEELRDTDWFMLDMGTDREPSRSPIDAEESTFILELSPQDCETVGIAQQRPWRNAGSRRP